MRDDAREEILAQIRAGLAGGDPVPQNDQAATSSPQLVKRVRPRISEDAHAVFIGAAERNGIQVRHVSGRADIPELIDTMCGPVPDRGGIFIAPSLSSLEWPQQWQIGTGKANPETKICVTEALTAVAETGTLVFCSGDDAPSAMNFVPETHVAVITEDRIVRHLEDAFQLIGRLRPFPRAVNFISGPSRTADVGGIVVRPAHGPKSVFLLIVRAASHLQHREQ